MNKPAITPAYLHKVLSTTAFNIANAIEDLSGNAEGIAAVYTPDFSIIAPVLFATAANGEKRFAPRAAEVSDWILANAPSNNPFKIAIGGPFYYEFLDQLHHKEQQISKLKRVVPRIGTRDIERLFTEDAGPTSKWILRSLEAITDYGIDRNILAPAEILKELIEKGAICGVGDYLKLRPSVPLSNIKEEFQRLVGNMKRERIMRDIPFRSRENSLFHYKMDAANICFAKFYRGCSNMRGFYVTKEWEQIRECLVEDALYARYYMTPLFLTNANLLENEGFIADSLEFLDESLEKCRSFLDRLYEYRDEDAWDEVPGILSESLLFFYEHTVTRLYQTGPSELEAKKERDIRELKELLSNRDKFAYSVERAEDSLRTAARLVPLDAEQLGLDQLEHLDIYSDPLFEKILSKFEI